MSTPPLTDRLARLGDDLERAVAARTVASVRVRRLRHGRSRGLLLAGVIGGVVLLGGGTAAAVALLTPEQEVANGLPNGAMIFSGYSPTCEAITDDTFRCVIDGGLQPILDQGFEGQLEAITDTDLMISGGCRGLDRIGSEWMCFLGQKSVDEGIIGTDFLGEYAPTPGVG